MPRNTVPRRESVDTVAFVLSLPAVAALIQRLDEARLTGRRGYGHHRLVALLVVKMIYSIPTWAKTVTDVREHPIIRELCGCLTEEDVPSQDACYRFTRKLATFRANFVEPFIADVQAALQAVEPLYGMHTALDSTTFAAYANGQKYVRRDGPLRRHYSDPDASWGHHGATGTRGPGGHYAYRLHGLGCTDTALPVTWKTETGKDSEPHRVDYLLAAGKRQGVWIETCAMDKNYDVAPVYQTCAGYRVKTVIPLSRNARDRDGNKVPSCEHGRWVFAGSEIDRYTTKWRCPAGVCTPAIRIKGDRFNPLIPRSTSRFGHLYGRRVVMEGVFGTLKTHYGLNRLFMRRLPKVRLHVDLCILGRLLWAITERSNT